MTWISTDLRDVPPGYIKHVCHKNRNIGLVTCLICDVGFCKSEFNLRVKSGKGFYVTRHIVVCPSHSNLSFEDFGVIDPNLDDESVIVYRKLTIMQKHIDNIKKGLNVTQEIDQDVMEFDDKADDDDALSVASNKKRRLSATNECSDCLDYMRELEFEKRINTELSNHNKELREHNAFLRNFTGEAQNLNVQNSYVNVLKNIPAKQECSRVTIKPKKDLRETC